MSIEFLLILLTSFTAATTIIQVIEMWILVKNQQRTNEILEHPIEMICHLAEDLKENKEAQAVFFELIAAMAMTGFNQVQQAIGKDIGKEIKDASNPLPKKYAWAWPLVKGFIPKKALQDAGVEAVVEATGWNL